MEIYVCFQVVPDLAAAYGDWWPKQPSELPIGRFTRTIDVYDESALELALRLRDSDNGIRLTAVTVSDTDDARLYGILFALGFHRVLRIDCPVKAFRPGAKAALLAKHIQDADLILAGRQSGMSGSRMTPRHLAEALSLPWLDDVCSLLPAEGGLSFRSAGGGEVRSGIVDKPAVLLVGESGWLRIPTLKEKLATSKMRAEIVPEELPLTEDTLPAQLFKREYVRRCTFLEGNIEQQADECIRIFQQQSGSVQITEDEAKSRPVYGGLMTAVFSETADTPLPVCPEAWPADYQLSADSSMKGLADAKKVVVAGRGANNHASLKEISKLLGADFGATRAAIMNGWYPIALQIGVSGAQLHAGCVLVLGASGAPALMSSLSQCPCVIAVNSDSNAAVFRSSDYGIVGDCKNFIDTLSKKLMSIGG